MSSYRICPVWRTLQVHRRVFSKREIREINTREKYTRLTVTGIMCCHNMLCVLGVTLFMHSVRSHHTYFLWSAGHPCWYQLEQTMHWCDSAKQILTGLGSYSQSGDHPFWVLLKSATTYSYMMKKHDLGIVFPAADDSFGQLFD